MAKEYYRIICILDSFGKEYNYSLSFNGYNKSKLIKQAKDKIKTLSNIAHTYEFYLQNSNRENIYFEFGEIYKGKTSKQGAIVLK